MDLPNDVFGIDVATVMAAEKLQEELTREYILSVLTWYPELFCLGGLNNSQLLFKGKYSEIYNSALDINTWNIAFNLKPIIDNGDFVFRMTLSSGNGNKDLIPKRLWIAQLIVLSDDLCVGLYEMGFDIIGYDRTSIIRRHTIENIIKDE